VPGPSFQWARLPPPTLEETDMQWIDPAYADIRLGFEVTAYVYVR
jgi:coenzyme PQQ precursor peptide PqqA